MRSLLAALTVIVSCAAGCAGNQGTIGSTPLMAVDPDAVTGTWALTDERNSTFNVIVREDGSATSTWSRGADGAKGEQGGWTIRDGILYVRYTDGWLDTVRVGRFGFEKLSYGPSEREGDHPSSFGQAIKVTDDSARWVGVWKTSSVSSGMKGEALFVCLSSDGSAVKSLDAINTGCWQLQPNGTAIYWSDGWFTMLTRNDDAIEGRSWAPGADRNGPATGAETWTEVRE
jgi:hypothetical protein